MKEPKFKVGDLVQLKSGSPVMTIFDIYEMVINASDGSTAIFAEVHYFWEGIFVKFTFREDQLEKPQ